MRPQVGGALRETEARLRAAAIATARQDAELLLAHVTGASRLALQLEAARPLAVAAWTRLNALVARRVRHEPLQYLLGEEDFVGLRLRVGPGVFIPRPETELLVDRAVAACPAGPATAVELCAGSGAVACGLAVRCPELRVFAVELAAEALIWARANVERLGLGARVRVLQGDLFAPLTAGGLTGPCDLVVANPPYIARSALRGLPVEVRDFEPVLALDGGPGGLAVITRILAEAPRYLRAGGRVLLEIGHDQAGSLRSHLAGDPRFGSPSFHRDLAGHERVLEVERLG